MDLSAYIDPEVLEERNRLVAEWFLDTKSMCEQLLGDSMFDTEFCVLHDKIFDALKDPCKKKLILAPRGLGKTTMMRAICIKAILYREKHFILYIGNSLTVAEMQTENLKRELITNQTIRKIFGDIRESLDSPDFADETFSKKAWVAFGSVLVLPRGSDQQIRGLNWNNYRPDLIILDDAENAKELDNEEQRKKTRRWLFADVLQCVSRVRKDYEIIYVDTLKHHDALPTHIMKMTDWHTTRLSICDENYQTYAEDFMSNDEIAAMVLNYTEDGDLDIFYREYMNIPIAPSTASFKQEYFIQYLEKDLTEKQLAALENVILIDPAKSVTPQADESAIVGLGIDVMTHKVYVRDVFHGRVYPDKLYDEAFAMAKRLNAHVIGLEVTSLNEFITFPFKNEMMRRGIRDIELVELKARRKKEERIASLIAFYRQGLILHNSTCCAPVENQLLQFPKGTHVDIIDALAYVVPMMEEGGRFFIPDMGRPGQPYNIEDEYADCYDEPALEIMEYLT